MIRIEYFNGIKLKDTGVSYPTEELAWLSLGNDCFDHRTVDTVTDQVLTENIDKEINDA